MGQPTILLIEDNEDNAAIYTACLEHFGHRVVRAADGAEGVRLARETSPSLILLDISLPVLSGWEVAEILRREERTAQTPILVCTAHDTAADRDRAAQLGCEGYLAKPCPPGVLLAEVERWLDAPASSPLPQPTAQERGWMPRRSRATRVALLSLGLALAATLAGVRAGLGGRRRRPRSPFPRLFGIRAPWPCVTA